MELGRDRDINDVAAAAAAPGRPAGKTLALRQ